MITAKDIVKESSYFTSYTSISTYIRCGLVISGFFLTTIIGILIMINGPCKQGPQIKEGSYKEELCIRTYSNGNSENYLSIHYSVYNDNTHYKMDKTDNTICLNRYGDIAISYRNKLRIFRSGYEPISLHWIGLVLFVIGIIGFLISLTGCNIDYANEDLPIFIGSLHIVYIYLYLCCKIIYIITITENAEKIKAFFGY